MIIKLLKDHALGKQGDIVNINFFRGKRLISEGIAIEQKQANTDTDTDTDKITDNGSNTKKRATRKRKANVKP